MFEIKNWEELDNTGSCYCSGINSSEWYYPTTLKSDGKVCRIDIKKKGQKLCSKIYVLNQTTEEITKTLASYGIVVKFIKEPILTKKEKNFLEIISCTCDKIIERCQYDLFLSYDNGTSRFAIDKNLFSFIRVGEKMTVKSLLKLKTEGE